MVDDLIHVIFLLYSKNIFLLTETKPDHRCTLRMEQMEGKIYYISFNCIAYLMIIKLSFICKIGTHC